MRPSLGTLALCHGACRAVLRRVRGQRKVECPCREARSGWHQLSLGRHLRSVEMVSVDTERRRSVGFHWGELYHKSQASRDLEVDRLKRWFRWSLRPVLVGRGQWRLRGICGTLREGLYLLCTASPHHALPGRVQSTWTLRATPIPTHFNSFPTHSRSFSLANECPRAVPTQNHARGGRNDADSDCEGDACSEAGFGRKKRAKVS